jgi:hypothetical protein
VDQLGFVRDAYLTAGVTHSYLNESYASNALILVTDQPGWVGGGNEAFIPLGAIVFWYPSLPHYMLFVAVDFVSHQG